MNKVITINLGGRSYSVEEPGYVALKNYIDTAEKNLASNPDKDEVLKDINFAIAEKCETYLSGSKNVVTTAEIEKIIQEMGPVESSETSDKGSAGANTAGTGSNSEDKSSAKVHKKLYRLPESGVLCGVCSGLAVYFDIDVTIIRVIFVVLALVTHAAWLLIYFIMAVVIPKANTPEEKAEAWGTMRMTAKDFIDRAQEGYKNLKNSGEWKKWKKQMKEEKRQWKQNWRQREYTKNYYYDRNGRQSPFFELMGNIMGILWLAFFVYISWYGYNHIQVVHDFFNTIGGILEQGVNWLKMKTGQ